MLVSMPFASFERPSIQLGLLKAIGVAHGFAVETRHFNLDFVSLIGVELYRTLTEHRGPLVGEWLFSKAAFCENAPDQKGQFLDVFQDSLAYLYNVEGVTPERLLKLRDDALPAMVDSIADSVDWECYRVVGFTTTFQQNAASFALARRIKARQPKTLTLFGGANFEEPMGREWVRSLPFIDYAIVGEADHAFPSFLAAMFDDESPESVTGVLSGQANGTVVDACPAAPFCDMDSLPTPDYREYFESAQRLGILNGSGRRQVSVPFESARGCWWGEKHHCTFCGLNARTMKFRSKHPSRVATELGELAKSCRTFQFGAVDNVVDMKYFNSLFPCLANSQTNYNMFYELKSNVNKDQLRMLALAGVSQIQPGIESLSSPVLRLMRKGVTAIQNVNVLRWSQYFGINASWNLLWGFPGEKPEHYTEQMQLARKIPHLRPPTGCGQVWMERFSPLFHDRDEFPDIDGIMPEASYQYVYPANIDLSLVAYFFDYENKRALPDEVYTEVKDLVIDWKAKWSNTEKLPILAHRSTNGVLLIEDRREPDNPRTWTFEEPLTSLYMSCDDRPRSIQGITRDGTVKLSAREVEVSLNEFVERGLIMRDGHKYLCLSVPSTDNG